MGTLGPWREGGHRACEVCVRLNQVLSLFYPHAYGTVKL